MPNKEPSSQTIEQLQARFENLKDRKLVVEVKRKSAIEQLNILKKDALERYGSDDLNELKKNLEKMKKENDRKRAEYQKSLEDIEKNLLLIDEQFERSESENIDP